MDRRSGTAIDARMDAVLARAGAFFMGKSPVQLAAEEIARRLEAAGIDYAVAGALSLGYHGFERTTEDVDILITVEGLARFKAEWLGRGYVNLRAGDKPVRDTFNNVRIDFLIAGELPATASPSWLQFRSPRKLRRAENDSGSSRCHASSSSSSLRGCPRPTARGTSSISRT